MRKWFGLMAVCVSAVSALAGCTNLGNGEIEQRQHEVSNVQQAVIQGRFDSFITASPRKETFFSVTTDSNMHNMVDHHLVANQLTVSVKQPYNASQSILEFVSSDLETLTLGGNQTVMLALDKPDVFSLNLDGSTVVTTNRVNMEKLALNVTGDTKLTMSGAVNQLTLIVHGEGRIDMTGLNSNLARVEIHGMAEVTLGHVNELEVVITGRGQVNYRNGPKVMVQSYISGMGYVVPYAN